MNLNNGDVIVSPGPRLGDEDLRLIFEQKAVGMCILTDDFRIRRMNSRFAEIAGLDDQALGKVVLESLLWTEDISALREQFKGLRDRASPSFSLEARCLCDDGQSRWVSLNVSARYATDGQVLHYFCVLEDICDRKAAEHRLRASEERFRMLADHVGDSIFLIDDAGKICDVNHHACVSLGAEREQLIGADARAFDLQIDDERILAIRRELLRREVVEFRTRYRRSDGTAFPVEVRLRSFFFEGTRWTIGVARDITQRVESERNLRDSEENLRQSQRIARMCSWRYDVAADRFSASGDGWQVVGFEFDPISVHDWKDLVHPDDDQLAWQGWQELLDSGKPMRAELRLLLNGNVEWVEVSADRVHDAALDRFQIVGLTRNITARKQLEDQLQRIPRMEAVGRLAGGVAHDFNNLLTVINGYCEILLRMPKLDAAVAEALKEIHEAGKRGGRLTRQLLTIGRNALVQTEVLNLNEVIEKMVSMLGRLAGDNIPLQIHLEPNLYAIRAGLSQIEQVVMNLSLNARDAMPEGGRLTIETSNVEPGDPLLARLQNTESMPWVRLSISDLGMGIKDEIRSKIFEPFFTTKSLGEGTGLGLAVVHGIMDQLGGHILIDSQSGIGTTFHLLFPRCIDQPRSKELVPAAPKIQPATVLLCEDQCGVREVTRQMLESLGYSVIESEDAETALNLAKQNIGRIQLLLTDVIMPRLSGRELANRVREIDPTVRVVLMSGYTNEGIALQGIQVEGEALLAKPFTLDNLSETLSHALRVTTPSPIFIKKLNP